MDAAIINSAETAHSRGIPDEAAPGRAVGTGRVLGEQWPMLARAIGRYQAETAERFTRLAYDKVSAGLIRLEERRELAAAAEDLGIRPFDAQLLIACAVRQWAMDHEYDATPRPDAPALSFEYRAWGLVWRRLALIAGLALALDGIIIWKWFS